MTRGQPANPGAELATPAPRPPRIALYGGAFDPPHRAHRMLIEACRAQLDLDRLLVIPTGNHPFKGDRHHAPAAARVALCRLAFGDLPYVAVSELEIARQGVGYTVDTLRAIRADVGAAASLFFLIGSDNLRALPQWRDHHAALALAQFVVVPRPGSTDIAAELRDLDLTGAERDGLLRHVLRVAPSAASSTEVRRLLAATPAEPGRLAELLDPTVLAAIRSRNLYAPR
jgi:nicotinate-nucleotide adenylyltransferase